MQAFSLVLQKQRQAAQRKYATQSLRAWCDAFARRRVPIDVSFRELIGPIRNGELSHSIYPYPARLLRQIPRFFLSCDQIAPPGCVVLDPFCGSGTVLVEA